MRFCTQFLTERGIKVFLVTLGCAALAALFVDIFLVALTLVFTGFIFYDYTKVKKAAGNINQLVKIGSNPLKEVLIAGKEKTVNLSCQVTTDLPVILSSPFSQVRIKPNQLKKGEHALELLLSSDISGDYTTDRVKADVFGPHKLTRKKAGIFFNLELKVFPRVIVPLIQATLFLLRGGRGGAGEVPIPFKGPGMEYADTREYVPGDSLHHMDWKATARQGKLMVKEFFQEAGQGVHIIYDIRAKGPISQDKLATNFLNVCLGVAEQGYPVGVTVHNGKEVLLHCVEDSPHQVLKMAMGYVLQSMRIELEDIDVLIDPASSSQIRSFLSKVKEKRVRKFLEFEAKVLGERLAEPYKFLTKLSHKMSEEKQFLLISQLSGEIVEILEFMDKIRGRHQLVIIQPTEPWKEAKDLEEAYSWYERQRTIQEILTRRGVRIVVGLSDIFKR